MSLDPNGKPPGGKRSNRRNPSNGAGAENEGIAAHLAAALGETERQRMVLYRNRTGALALRLIVGLALLGCPRAGAAQGTWSVISLPRQSGEIGKLSALAADAAGNLYVADNPDWPDGGGRIRNRDAQGNWSVIATYGTGLGQVDDDLGALAADVGNLFVADYSNGGRIRKRDAQGNWSVIAGEGSELGQITALAVDTEGNLYIAYRYSLGGCGSHLVRGRITKRDALGNWSLVADFRALAPAVDTAGNLYAAGGAQIQKRDTQGNWSVVEGFYDSATDLAVDTAGNLYVAQDNISVAWAYIWKRDDLGNWSAIATDGQTIGEVEIGGHVGLAVDGAGNLYVADTENNRVLTYTPDP
jgi:hypothetical protein